MFTHKRICWTVAMHSQIDSSSGQLQTASCQRLLRGCLLKSIGYLAALVSVVCKAFATWFARAYRQAMWIWVQSTIIVACLLLALPTRANHATQQLLLLSPFSTCSLPSGPHFWWPCIYRLVCSLSSSMRVACGPAQRILKSRLIALVCPPSGLAL